MISPAIVRSLQKKHGASGEESGEGIRHQLQIKCEPVFTHSAHTFLELDMNASWGRRVGKYISQITLMTEQGEDPDSFDFLL